MYQYVAVSRGAWESLVSRKAFKTKMVCWSVYSVPEGFHNEREDNRVVMSETRRRAPVPVCPFLRGLPVFGGKKDQARKPQPKCRKARQLREPT